MKARHDRNYFRISIWMTALLAMLAATLSGARAQQADYQLGPGDQVTVMIYGQTAQPLALTVTERGLITLPLIGAIGVASSTPQAAAEKIKQELMAGGFLADPIVNVEVTNYVSQTVTVLGGVRNPGVYPLSSRTPLSRLLAEAGGQVEGREVVHLRRAGTGVRRFTMAQVAAGGEGDPVLQPGDVVYVPPTPNFYIYGEVRSPGVYSVLPGMTFRQALAHGGGQTAAGTERGIRLFRGGKELEINDLDQQVLDGDVFFIRERLF